MKVTSQGKGNSVVAFLYLVIRQRCWGSTAERVGPGGSKLWDWVLQEGKCRALNPTRSSPQALLVPSCLLAVPIS